MATGKMTTAESRPLVKDKSKALRGNFSNIIMVRMLLYLMGCKYQLCSSLHALSQEYPSLHAWYLISRRTDLESNDGAEDWFISWCQFCGNGSIWIPYRSDVKTQIRYAISVAGCPVIWKSKLQMETVLSASDDGTKVAEICFLS